jgi:hypothetical protein
MIQRQIMNQLAVLFAQKTSSRGNMFDYFLAVTSITNTVLTCGFWISLELAHCGKSSSSSDTSFNDGDLIICEFIVEIP